MEPIFVVAAILATVTLTIENASAQIKRGEQPTNTNDEKWRIETKWVAEVIGGGGRVDKELGAFDSYDEAESTCQEWSKANPKDFRLTRTRKTQVRVRDLPPLTPKPQPADPPLTRKMPAPTTRAVLDKSNPDSVAGKRASGTLGKFDLALAFGDDGKVTFTEAGQSKRQVAKGEWTQTGRAVTINTPDYRYMGLVEGNKITGKRVSKQLDLNVTEAWNATFDIPVSSQKDKAEPEKGRLGAKEVADIQLAGTSWMRRDTPNIGNDSGLTFLDENKLRVSVYPDGRRQGTWKVEGTKITITLTNDDSYVGTIKGHAMSIDFGRGPRTLYKQ